jgi:hypothetical protein
MSMTDHLLADPPPDPSRARTPADYVALLDQLRLWCGNPSLRRLRQLGGLTVSPSGAKVHALAPSTMSYVLTGRGLPRLPKLEFVRRFVGACLEAYGHPEPAAGQEVDRWIAAWRHLAQSGAEQAAPAVAPPSEPATGGRGTDLHAAGAPPPPAHGAVRHSGAEPARRPWRRIVPALLLVGALVSGAALIIGQQRHQPAATSASPARAARPPAVTAYPAANVELTPRLDLSLSRVRVSSTDTWLQAGGSYRAYLAFDLPPAAGRRPKSALLILWNHGSPGCGPALDTGIQVRRVTSPWSGTALSPTRQPTTTVAGAALNRAAFGGPGCDGDYLRFDVTAIVRAWAAGEPNHGLQLRARDESSPRAWRRFYASERDEEGGPPRLDIVYNAVPETPSRLSHTVGATSLVLSAGVADADGEWLDAEFELSPDPAGGAGTGIWRGSASARTGRPGTVTVGRDVLRPGVLYRWRVRGSDGTDSGPWSPYQYVRLPSP